MLLHRKIPLPVVFLVIAGLLGAVGLWVWLNYDDSRDVTTYRALRSFKITLNNYGSLYGRIAGPDLRDAVNALLKDKVFAQWQDSWRLVVRGTDGWGRPFIYKWQPDGKRAVIRSVGPNGIDEGGGGDDIQVVVSVE